MYIYLIQPDNDFDRPFKTPVIHIVQRGVQRVNIEFTYSMSITRLSPPTYVTNCRKYSKYAFKSKYNCIAECVRKKTIDRKFLLDSYIIDEAKFKNSNLPVIFSNNSRKDEIHQIEKNCKDSCRQFDCEMEVLTTLPVLARDVH